MEKDISFASPIIPYNINKRFPKTKGIVFFQIRL